MKIFTQLFGDLLAFVSHGFDRIVIYGYLSGLSRPEQVVSAADRMGREGGAQGGPCRAVATAHGTQTRLRRLLHLQEHGAGADLPGQRTEISHQGPASPDPRPPAQPLHALLFLYSRRNSGPDGNAGGLVLP